MGFVRFFFFGIKLYIIFILFHVSSPHFFFHTTPTKTKTPHAQTMPQTVKIETPFETVPSAVTFVSTRSHYLKSMSLSGIEKFKSSPLLDDDDGEGNDVVVYPLTIEYHYTPTSGMYAVVLPRMKFVEVWEREGEDGLRCTFKTPVFTAAIFVKFGLLKEGGKDMVEMEVGGEWVKRKFFIVNGTLGEVVGRIAEKMGRIVNDGGGVGTLVEG